MPRRLGWSAPYRLRAGGVRFTPFSGGADVWGRESSDVVAGTHAGEAIELRRHGSWWLVRYVANNTFATLNDNDAAIVRAGLTQKTVADGRHYREWWQRKHDR